MESVLFKEVLELFILGTLCAIVLYYLSAAQNTKLLFVEIKPMKN
jgi:hypothetical protein